MQSSLVFMFDVLEETDNFKPVLLSAKLLNSLEMKLEQYRHRLTQGQFDQCMAIWEYDPKAAVRYCKVILKYKGNKTIYYE